jgi:hypothetical protein
LIYTALLGKDVDFMAVGSNFVGQTGTGEDDDVEKFTEVKNLQKVDVAAVQKNALSFFYIV